MTKEVKSQMAMKMKTLHENKICLASIHKATGRFLLSRRDLLDLTTVFTVGSGVELWAGAIVGETVT